MRVVAAAVLQGGRLLAAQRAPGGARGGLWELPGGKVEAGESDHEALTRELREELGVEAEVLGPLAQANHAYADVQITLVAYRVRLLAEPIALEHQALRWVQRDAIDDLNWAAADLPLLEAVRPLLPQ